jgi:hypothetical protein
MAGLVPAIHAVFAVKKKGVDAGNKCGHDEGESCQCRDINILE